MMKLRMLLLLGGLLTLAITFGALSVQRVSAANSNKPINFTLRDINGKQVKLSDYRGKVVVVDVWAPRRRPPSAQL